ncbi:MAG: hypothetical protein NVSMB5_08230 [Candidatus Velthaea sp.]
MSEILRYPDCDLRVHPPRSARAKIGGLFFLPRTIDKMRAKIQGTLGEYKIGPGISMYLFEWLGITEAQFEDAVRGAKNDEDVVEWLLEHTDPAHYEEINVRLETRGIRDDAHLQEVLPRYPMLREHPQLRNWFEIFEVDDEWIFDPKNKGAGARAPT